MTIEELREKIRDWDSRVGSSDSIAPAKYTSILNQLEYHAANEWSCYSPADHSDFNPNYIERLAKWIGNLTAESDQKLLLEYALHISFFSHNDFKALYQTAFTREVSAWVATQVGARLDHNGGQGFHDLIHYNLHRRTWYCPVTDSMDINEFCKVNHIKGIRYRPQFDNLQTMAGPGNTLNPQIAAHWIQFMATPSNSNPPPPPLEWLVLLEDIVGSGSQCLPAVRWAVETFGKPVLFIPLILCPNGVEALRAEELRWGGQLSVRPVIELGRGDLIGPEGRGENVWPIAQNVEDLAVRSMTIASPCMDPFGYETTGCSLVKFSNTPDNTLPIVHNKTPNWEPLFPRVYRD